MAFCFLAHGAFAASLKAQQPSRLVLHLWVDPVYGDDGTGATGVQSYFNPDGSTSQLNCGTPVNAPHAVLDPGQSNNTLLHAPHPFKTVTAAVAYVNRLGSIGVAPLPHTEASTGKTWEYCIIHMLPGWYGRLAPTTVTSPSHSLLTATHAANGLVPNGETFPIHLPPRVSLQGTSALNTIVDTGQAGTAIEFGKIVNGVCLSGQGSFIDSITFYACGGSGGLDPRAEAAILIDDKCPCGGSAVPTPRLTITNCIFARNIYGVLVSASPPNNNDVDNAHDGVTIMNCTFGWNIVGVWNGQVTVALASGSTAANSRGVSRLILINNIFDASQLNDSSATSPNLGLPCDLSRPVGLPRSWPTHPVGTGFEGVSKQDMQVVLGATLRDTNAYESGLDNNNQPDRNYNTQNAPPPPAIQSMRTAARVAGVFDPDAGYNIASITGHPNQSATPATPRGILFVNDLICRGRGATPPIFYAGAGFDGSMLDFRLSPAILPAVAQLLAPTALNPLVDAGFAGPFPVTMANGETLQHPPGFLPLGQDQAYWSYHSLRFDAEGYGNPRIYDHPVYPNTGPGVPVPGVIDVGADEMGDQIVAGYRLGTTTFLRLRGEPNRHPDNPNPDNLVVDNQRLWYLGAPSNLLPPGVGARVVDQPSYRAYDTLNNAPFYPPAYDAAAPARVLHSGEDFGSLELRRPWYAIRNQQTPSRVQPAAVRPSNSPPSGLGYLPQLGNAYRATWADATPYLRPDIHPWWALVATQLTTRIYEAPPILSLWQNCSSNPMGFYNWFLYWHPDQPVVNPPGSFVGFATSSGSFQWLDGQNITGVDPSRSAVFENWSAATRLNDFDTWCRGGSGSAREFMLPATACPPITELYALRFTLEWPSSAPLWNVTGGYVWAPNMQTFLVVVDGP